MQITFPGLGLNLHISKIAFTIFNIEIYWYAIFIVVSIIISLIILKIKDGMLKINFYQIVDLFIYLIPISFIFARLYYVIFNINYYKNNINNILNIRDGGLAIYGGLIGGIITCLIYCKKKKINILDLTDYIVPCLALSQSIGRWGNFTNIEAYGTTTNLPWRMGIIENNILKEVHPTFLYESIITFTLFIILSKINKKRNFKGETTIYYLIVYSFARFFIEELRIDSLMLYNVKISQLLSAIIFVVSCFTLSKIIKKCKSNKQKEKKC